MWNIVANNYLEYGVKVIVADTEADKPKIPTPSCRFGSMLFIIENSKTYMLTSAKEWKEVKGSPLGGAYGGGGSSSGSSSSSDEYTIVDGGTAAG